MRNCWRAMAWLPLMAVVKVFLDGKPAIAFTDDRFAKGQILLEGRTHGVKYRNLTVRAVAR